MSTILRRGFRSHQWFTLKQLINFSDKSSGNGLKEEAKEDVALDDTEEEENYCKLPKWLYKYLVFRFNLLDRLQEISPPKFITPSFNPGLLNHKILNHEFFLNSYWHEGWYFYVLFGSDFVSWIFINTFQTFLEVKIDINRVNLTPCQAQWVLWNAPWWH